MAFTSIHTRAPRETGQVEMVYGGNMERIRGIGKAIAGLMSSAPVSVQAMESGMTGSRRTSDIRSRARSGVVSICIAAAISIGAVGSAAAQPVTFDWNPSYAGIGNGLGSGSMTINLGPTVADTANFTNVAGTLTALSFTWTGGNGTTISLSDVTAGIPTSFSAGGGYLITGFSMSRVTAGLFFQLANSAGLPGNPGPGSNNIQAPGTPEIDSGVWQLRASTPVPVPAAVWLLGSALAGLGVMRRRRNR
jgi:hypothetical protein